MHPECATPFWTSVKPVDNKCKLSLYLVCILWTCEFNLNSFLFVTTKSSMYCTVLYWYCTVLYCTVLVVYYTVLYCTSTVLYSTLLYWYCTVPYRTFIPIIVYFVTPFLIIQFWAANCTKNFESMFVSFVLCIVECWKWVALIFLYEINRKYNFLL